MFKSTKNRKKHGVFLHFKPKRSYKKRAENQDFRTEREPPNASCDSSPVHIVSTLMSFRDNSSDSDSEFDARVEESLRSLRALNFANRSRSRSPPSRRSHLRNRELLTASILANMATGGGNNIPANPLGNINPPAPLFTNFKTEYLQMVPEFNGNQGLLGEFLRLAGDLITQFCDPNVDNFQNKFILNCLKNKIVGKAKDDISTYTITTWMDLRNALLATYADKRDLQSLTIELCELRQNKQSAIDFFNSIQKNLNLQIAYCNNHYADNKKVILIENATELGLRIFLKYLNKPLGDYIATRNPSTLQEALRIVTNDFQANQTTPVVPTIQQRFPPRINNFPPRNFYNPPQGNFYRPAQGNSYRAPYQAQQQKPQSQNAFRPNPNYVAPKPVPMSISTANTSNFNRYRDKRHENHLIEEDVSVPQKIAELSRSQEPNESNFLGETASSGDPSLNF